MDTKKILKYLKLNESNISMVLGALVIVVLGVIVINYFKNQNAGEVKTGTSTESQPTEQPALKRGDGPVQYTVLANETLWSISVKQYGTGFNWVDIAKASNLANPDAIEVGQKLTIPDVEPKIPSVKTTNIGETNYKVVKGDSLWNIAVREYGSGYQWIKIAKANNLENPNLIHSGNTLSIPK